MTHIKQIVPAILVIGLSILFVGLFLILYSQTKPVDASVARFAEYNATTTSTILGIPAETLIQTGPGTLGSVVIIGAAAGTINLYDATTSDITKRGSTATSSLLVASFAASAAVGTYTFDVLLTRGLYVSMTGTMPTTTITYRPN